MHNNSFQELPDGDFEKYIENLHKNASQAQNQQKAESYATLNSLASSKHQAKAHNSRSQNAYKHTTNSTKNSVHAQNQINNTSYSQHTQAKSSVSKNSSLNRETIVIRNNDDLDKYLSKQAQANIAHSNQANNQQTSKTSSWQYRAQESKQRTIKVSQRQQNKAKTQTQSNTSQTSKRSNTFVKRIFLVWLFIIIGSFIIPLFLNHNIFVLDSAVVKIGALFMIIILIVLLSGGSKNN